MPERALDNLLRNMLRSNPVGQPIELSVAAGGNELRLSMRDHGPDADPEHLAQLG